MSKEKYKYRKYDIQSYNSAWPSQFQAIASAITKIFGKDAIEIEHIGSTSVPEMIGKPTIDLLITVNNLPVAHKYVADMQRMGYEYLPNYVLQNTILFRRIENNVLLANIHIFEKDHPHVHEMISLRNYLRSHPEEVMAYSNLKKNLFQKYPDDYANYRKLKDDYMENLKRRALRM